MNKSEAMVLIEAAKYEKVKLSDWEEVFIKSIQRLGELHRLSDKQRVIVERIYGRATGQGDREFHKRI